MTETTAPATARSATAAVKRHLHSKGLVARMVRSEYTHVLVERVRIHVWQSFIFVHPDDVSEYVSALADFGFRDAKGGTSFVSISQVSPEGQKVLDLLANESESATPSSPEMTKTETPAAHKVSVECAPGRGGVIYWAACHTCTYRSWTYPAEHAAQTMADAHRNGEV